MFLNFPGQDAIFIFEDFGEITSAVKPNFIYYFTN